MSHFSFPVALVPSFKNPLSFGCCLWSLPLSFVFCFALQATDAHDPRSSTSNFHWSRSVPVSARFVSSLSAPIFIVICSRGPEISMLKKFTLFTPACAHRWLLHVCVCVAFPGFTSKIRFPSGPLVCFSVFFFRVRSLCFRPCPSNPPIFITIGIRRSEISTVKRFTPFPLLVHAFRGWRSILLLSIFMGPSCFQSFSSRVRSLRLSSLPIKPSNFLVPRYRWSRHHSFFLSFLKHIW